MREFNLRRPESLIQTEGQVNNLNRLIKKKEDQGGIVTGFHGTSSNLARKILKEGFENKECVEGRLGVYFWDEEVANNAKSHGRRKSEKLGESEFAIIKAELKNARPDLLMARPQWLVDASDIVIKDVKFYKKEEVSQDQIGVEDDIGQS